MGAEESAETGATPVVNPLTQLKEQSAALGACNEQGERSSDGSTATPWAMQIAYSAGEGKAPALKTVGFQRVSEEGIDFMTAKHAQNLDGLAVSICYTAGAYPPEEGSKCSQWRIEGTCKGIGADLMCAKPGSLAQVLSSAAWRQDKEADEAGRVVLDDAEGLAQQTEAIKERLANEEVTEEELAGAI